MSDEPMNLGEDPSDFSSTPRTCEEDLTQEQKDEILEAFTFFDLDGDELISTMDVGKVMRALGQVPTICEETDIAAEFAIKQCNTVNFEDFKRIIKKRMQTFDEDNELRESFRRFDKENTGTVDIGRLSDMLTTMGEPLTDEEVNDWLKDAEEFILDGRLEYEGFATYMLSK